MGPRSIVGTVLRHYHICPSSYYISLARCLHSVILFLITSNIMSLSVLTREELHLHVYAALVQKDLETYRTSVSGDRTNWKLIFEYYLVRL